MAKSFEDRLKEVVLADPRYPLDAYRFVYEALDYTLKKLNRQGHVSGRELLEGIRDYALEQFGGMTLMVFGIWGITGTQDFGNIVFNLVDAGLMGRTENDSRQDFADVYEFGEVFRIDAIPGRIPGGEKA